jgi:hypothetical protein
MLRDRNGSKSWSWGFGIVQPLVLCLGISDRT